VVLLVLLMVRVGSCCLLLSIARRRGVSVPLLPLLPLRLPLVLLLCLGRKRREGGKLGVLLLLLVLLLGGCCCSSSSSSCSKSSRVHCSGMTFDLFEAALESGGIHLPV